MSSIFDDVDIATSRRKNKVLDTRHTRSIFGAQGPGSGVPGAGSGTQQSVNAGCTSVLGFVNGNTSTERPPELPFVVPTSASKGLVEPTQHTSYKFTPHDAPSSLKIDAIWAACVLGSLVPLFVSVYGVLIAPTFSAEMLALPYQCNLFYFGLLCGLPGITVHIFCLSLIFHQLCRSGVVLSLLSTFLMIVGIEHACMSVPSVSTDYTFYLLALSVYCGLLAQGFFVSILYHESKQKQFYIGMLGVAFVLVTLSILCIALSKLNSETPHTKPTVLVRILPLSAAIVIYALSTYWTLFPVRVVCNNM